MNTKKYLPHSFCFTLLILISACSGGASGTDWDRMALNGKVKSFEENSHETEMKSGEWQVGQPRPYGRGITHFDTNGNFLSSEVYDNELGLVFSYKSKIVEGIVTEEASYDKDGNLRGKTVLDRKSASKLVFMNYDLDGNKTGEGVTLMENGLIVKQEVEYLLDDGSTDKFITTYQHDENGNVIRQKQTNKAGDLTFDFRYEYLEFDEQNNWTKKLEYSEDVEEPGGIVIRKYEYYRQ